MADETEKSALERIAETLLAHHVEFIVIGGQAEVLHGSPRVTYDVDLCYRRSAENLRNLAAALGELKPSLRGAPPDLPFRVDAEALALGCNFTFATALGDLDLLGYLEPLGAYEDIAQRAQTYRVGDLELRAIALEDSITIKEHLGRPRDREALWQLLAIKRLRDESQR
ncbi:MAG: hypothetical protein ACYSUI_02315 [Planctomycetota bacterium]|jgi:predicted nucleotidyltransferase